MAPQIIKKDVSEQEYAVISENLANLPGVDASELIGRESM